MRAFRVGSFRVSHQGVVAWTGAVPGWAVPGGAVKADGTLSGGRM